MFTRAELNVLQQALRTWKGPYGMRDIITDKEVLRRNRMLTTANSLAERFEEILNDYADMESKYLMDSSPFGYDK